MRVAQSRTFSRLSVGAQNSAPVRAGIERGFLHVANQQPIDASHVDGERRREGAFRASQTARRYGERQKRMALQSAPESLMERIDVAHTRPGRRLCDP